MHCTSVSVILHTSVLMLQQKAQFIWTCEWTRAVLLTLSDTDREKAEEVDMAVKTEWGQPNDATRTATLLTRRAGGTSCLPRSPLRRSVDGRRLHNGARRGFIHRTLHIHVHTPLEASLHWSSDLKIWLKQGKQILNTAINGNSFSNTKSQMSKHQWNHAKTVY